MEWPVTKLYPIRVVNIGWWWAHKPDLSLEFFKENWKKKVAIKELIEASEVIRQQKPYDKYPEAERGQVQRTVLGGIKQ